MLTTTRTLCIRCQQSLVTSNLWNRGIQTTAVLQRHKTKRKPGSSAFRELISRPTRHADSLPPRGQRPEHHRSKVANVRRLSTPEQVRQKLNEGLYRWAQLPATLARLKAMGLADEHAELLLNIFVEERPKIPGGWFPPEEDDKWQMQRIQDDMLDSLPGSVDRALTRRFMAWALETSRTRGIVPASVYSTLAAVQNAVDYTHPAEWYPVARMLRREIHMHVGPTNSGKTHNALRALAASQRGVYASPLRLLAYEVFDRLNKGQITPLNADPSADPETFKRACNLITGEEVRMVDEDAPLLSCTVEMLDMSKRYEVAVVDEIQMIADADRGGSWSAAVLGLHAQEVHLCGEAGAVPLVQEMLKETGDELIVHRYERLTPLVVASESLKGDLRKIEKGDCIVSFSRTMLFSIKKNIEEVTGMRCAIIYGRLPPEVRSEQAELFNDPNSGYDVLVGSDAIGMGLNLKIKRIIFESSVKYDGDVERVLSYSQLKQIAGRAGRYGLNDDESGGVVTTLHEFDLPIVRKAVETRTLPIAKRAVMPTTKEMFHSIEQLIRPRASFSSVFDIFRSASLMPPYFILRDLDRAGSIVIPVIDQFCTDYTLEERLRVMMAPVQWRDNAVAMAMERFLRMYRKDMHVKFKETLRGLGLVEALGKIREKIAAEEAEKSLASSSEASDASGSSGDFVQDVLPKKYSLPLNDKLLSVIQTIEEKSAPPQVDALLKLESLYRVAVVYMWFSLRLPLVFSEREEAVAMKEECEESIEWCLVRLQAAKALSKKKERRERREKERMEKEKEKERKLKKQGIEFQGPTNLILDGFKRKADDPKLLEVLKVFSNVQDKQREAEQNRDGLDGPVPQKDGVQRSATGAGARTEITPSTAVAGYALQGGDFVS